MTSVKNFFTTPRRAAREISLCGDACYLIGNRVADAVYFRWNTARGSKLYESI